MLISFIKIYTVQTYYNPDMKTAGKTFFLFYQGDKISILPSQ